MGSSGWLIMYYVGVFRAIRLVFGDHVRKSIEVHGISGGAIVGTIFMCNTKLVKVRRYILDCVERSSKPKHFPAYTHNFGCEDFPDDSHKRVRDRLKVYYASFPSFKLQSVGRDAYVSKLKVVNANELAVNVPGFCSFLPFKVTKGVWGFDAGIVTYFPVTSKVCRAQSIVSVTPFREFERCGDNGDSTTICPRVRIPMHWAGFPPNTRVLVLSEQLGFYDAICYFATTYSNQGGTMPPQDVQQLFCNKLQHILKLRSSVEAELRQHITFKQLIINYVVCVALWLYRVLFG